MTDKIILTKEQFERIKKALEWAFDTLYVDYGTVPDDEFSVAVDVAVDELRDVLEGDIIDIEDANGLI